MGHATLGHLVPAGLADSRQFARRFRAARAETSRFSRQTRFNIRETLRVSKAVGRGHGGERGQGKKYVRTFSVTILCSVHRE